MSTSPGKMALRELSAHPTSPVSPATSDIRDAPAQLIRPLVAYLGLPELTDVRTSSLITSIGTVSRLAAPKQEPYKCSARTVGGLADNNAHPQEDLIAP